MKLYFLKEGSSKKLLTIDIKGMSLLHRIRFGIDFIMENEDPNVLDSEVVDIKIDRDFLKTLDK